ncbi:hypothetical protein BCV72DRAFT_300966 [Rhizopus microsporus var. microsporus]|uniref:Uncharacterized protein n=1 Tax=Rhizopus microsporus var. microsporus TaxID=86635 RepID=A0A1X0RHA0_RHIZD|nr:hypothetical protein BCV72DRAFT_300966 [Rhizopus microsporus var. microsporus]
MPIHCDLISPTERPSHCYMLDILQTLSPANTGFHKILITNEYPRFLQLYRKTTALLLQGHVLLSSVFLPLYISGSASTTDLDAVTRLTPLCRPSIPRVGNLGPHLRPQSYPSPVSWTPSDDYRSFQQREMRDIGCYIERSLANNVYIPLFQVNTIPCRVHSVVALMKLRLIFSAVVLTKSYCERWFSISSFQDYPAHLLKLNNPC